MAGIAIWMCVWWITEAVSFAVTALVPIFAMPLLGIASIDKVAPEYSDPIIFLFIGGFMLAFAIEKWGLHKRIALKILSIVGTKPKNFVRSHVIGLFNF